MAGRIGPIALARMEALVARALAIIRTRACDPTFSRSVLARELGVSASCLVHAVRRLTGLTITQHICQARVAAAETLLLDLTRSIKEVAFAVGFGTASTLDRWFVRDHETTPREWRAREFERRLA
ncbi:MAG: helix-turn-helix domain-containing protein [Gemmatimonadaceae bacterium]